MRAHIDRRTRPPKVVLTMHLEEFRETVEWLETLDPNDGATKDWRFELDRVDPPSIDDSMITNRGPSRG